MQLRALFQALSLAALGGVIAGFILDVVFLSQINIVSLAVITYCAYMTFQHNELFWEMVEKFKRK